jgi:hypothetical protein
MVRRYFGQDLVRKNWSPLKSSILDEALLAFLLGQARSLSPLVFIEVAG